jgi:hypothetical protein
MKPTIPLYATLATPVHWLTGEASLRAYLAQRDHFLQLHDHAPPPGFCQHTRGPEQPGDREAEDIALALR